MSGTDDIMGILCGSNGCLCCIFQHPGLSMEYGSDRDGNGVRTTQVRPTNHTNKTNSDSNTNGRALQIQVTCSQPYLNLDSSDV